LPVLPLHALHWNPAARGLRPVEKCVELDEVIDSLFAVASEFEPEHVREAIRQAAQGALARRVARRVSRMRRIQTGSSRDAIDLKLGGRRRDAWSKTIT